MHKNNIYFIAVVVSIILLSCTDSKLYREAPINPTAIIGSTHATTPQFSPTATQSPIVTDSLISFECLEVNTTSVDDIKIKGSIVILNPDLASFNTIPYDSVIFPRQSASSIVNRYAVSPDYEKLAYYETNSDTQAQSRFVIVGPKITPNNYIPKNDWLGLAGWLNNRTILFEKNIRNNDGYVGNPVPLIAWDVTSDQVQELAPDYPGIYSLFPEIVEWGNFRFSEVMYNPSLEFAIYPKMTPYDSLVLWDIKAKRQVTSLTGFVFFGLEPKWSPDGNYFVIAKYPENSTKYLPEFKSKQELFRISKTGSIDQLTYLTDEFDISFGHYSWSPNGKYIAFWLYSSFDYPDSDWPYNAKFPRLAVLDSTTRKIKNYCITGGSFSKTSNNTPVFNSPDAPIWSPDSTELVVQSPSENGNAVVIINIQMTNSSKILDLGLPIGWLIEK